MKNQAIVIAYAYTKIIEKNISFIIEANPNEWPTSIGNDNFDACGFLITS